MAYTIQFGEAEKAAIPLILRYDLLRRREFRDNLSSLLSSPHDHEIKPRIQRSCWEIMVFLVEEYISGRVTIISDIHIQIGMSKSTVSRQLRLLIKQGVILRIIDSYDHRRYQIRLTTETRRVVDKYLTECADEFKDLIELHDKHERHKAQEALKAGQHELAEKSVLLQVTLDSIDHGFAVWDHQQRLVVWNKKCETNIWYYPKFLRVGMMITELLRHLAGIGVFGPGDQEQLAQQKLQEIIASGHNSEEEFIQFDGRHIHLRNYPMPNNGYASVYHDVTERRKLEQGLRDSQSDLERKVEERTLSLTAEIIERKRIEKDLRQTSVGLLHSEHRFRDFAEAASDWFWETDENHRYRFVSTRYGNRTGFSVERIIGKSILETYPKGVDSKIWKSFVDRMTNQQQFRDVIQPRNTPEGDTIWISINGNPFFDDCGTFKGYRGTAIEVTGRVTAEETLRKSEQRFKDFSSVTSDWFWETDDKNQFTYFSDEFEIVTGIRPDQLLGKSRQESRPPGINDADWNAWMKDMAERRGFRHVIHSRILPDDRTVWVSVSGIPCFDNQNNFTGYRGTGTNITNEIQASKKNQETQRLLYEAIEIMEDGFVLYDAQDRLVVCNQKYKDFHYQIADMIKPGITFTEIIQAATEKIQSFESVADKNTWLKNRIEKHINPKGPFELKLANGQWLRVFEQKTTEGGIIGLRIDISEEKRVEEERKKSRDELELRIVNRTKALTREIHERRVIEADLLNRTEIQNLLYNTTAIANEAKQPNIAMALCLKEICAYTTWPVGHIYTVSPTEPDKLFPTDIWHLEDPDWHSNFYNITMRTVFKKGVGLPGLVLSTGKPEWIENVDLHGNFPRAKHGLDIHVKAGFCFPVKVKNKTAAVMEFYSPFDQKVDQALMNCIEHIGTQLGRLLERAEAATTLLKAKEVAEAASQTKSVFLSSMSHELRTPLNAIIGFSSIMKEQSYGPVGSAKYLEYSADIHYSGQHLLELINDILDVSSIEAGALVLHEETINLVDIVDDTVHLIKPRADEGKVTVKFSVNKQIPLVYADERRMKQILLNLLSNAVKFTPENGDVFVSAHLNIDNSLVINVADTGVGMNEDEITIALSMFEQVDNQFGSKNEGTGLGLPLTKELVEIHGGVLEVKSVKGRGTIITVTLPSERVILN